MVFSQKDVLQAFCLGVRGTFGDVRCLSFDQANFDFKTQRSIDEFHQAIHSFNLSGRFGVQALVCDLCPLPQTAQGSAV